VRITTTELAAMRAIFDLFDRDGTGSINAAELLRLHAKLGEPISEEEAADAVKEIGAGKGVITFEVSLAWRWWEGGRWCRRCRERTPAVERPLLPHSWTCGCTSAAPPSRLGIAPACV
jgi:hypothetical protein